MRPDNSVSSSHATITASRATAAGAEEDPIPPLALLAPPPGDRAPNGEASGADPKLDM